MEQLIIRDILNWADILWPTIFAMSIIFGPLLRFSLYYVQAGKWRFIEQLERRIMRHGNNEYEDTRQVLFHDLFKKLLEKTHYEIFFLRTQNKRRRFDLLFSYLDEIYNMEDVCQVMVDQGINYSLYISKRSRDFNTVKYFMLEKQTSSELIFGFIKWIHLNKILNALPIVLIVSGVVGGIIEFYLQLIDIDTIEEFKWVPFSKVALNYFLVGVGLGGFQWLINVLLSAEVLAKNSLLGLENGLKCIWEISVLDEIIEREGLSGELEEINSDDISEDTNIEQTSSKSNKVRPERSKEIENSEQEKLLNKYMGISNVSAPPIDEDIGTLIAAKNKLKGKTWPSINLPEIKDLKRSPIDNLLSTGDDTMNSAMKETFDLVASSDLPKEEDNATQIIKIKVNRSELHPDNMLEKMKSKSELATDGLPDLPDLPSDVKNSDNAA